MDERLLVLLIIDGIFFISWVIMTLFNNKLDTSEKHREELFNLVKYVTFAIVGYQVATGGLVQ